MTLNRVPPHGIVNVTHRGILGGWANLCSCGATIIEPDGGHEATDAHLAGPPNPPRESLRDRYRRVVAERDAAQDRIARALEAFRDPYMGASLTNALIVLRKVRAILEEEK